MKADDKSNTVYATSAVHMRKLTFAVIGCLSFVAVLAIVLVILLAQSRSIDSKRVSSFEYLLDALDTVKASIEEEAETLKLIHHYDDTLTWYDNSKLLREKQAHMDESLEKVYLFYHGLTVAHEAHSFSPFDELNVAGIYYQRTKVEQRATTVSEASIAFREFRETAAGLMLGAAVEYLPEVQGAIMNAVSLLRIGDAMGLEAAAAANSILDPSEVHLKEFYALKVDSDVGIASELDAVSYGIVSSHVLEAATEEYPNVKTVHTELESRMTHVPGAVASDAEAATLAVELEAMKNSLNDIFAYAQGMEPDAEASLVGFVCLVAILVIVLVLIALLLRHWNKLENESVDERLSRARAATMRRAVRRMERFISSLCKLDLNKQQGRSSLRSINGADAKGGSNQGGGGGGGGNKLGGDSDFLTEAQEEESEDEPLLMGGGGGSTSGEAAAATMKQGVEELTIASNALAEEDKLGENGVDANDQTNLEAELYKLSVPGKMLPKFLHPFVVKRYRRQAAPSTKTTSPSSSQQQHHLPVDSSSPGSIQGTMDQQGSFGQAMSQTSMPQSFSAFGGRRSGRSGSMGGSISALMGPTHNHVDLGDKLSMYECTVLFISLAGYQRKPTSDSVKAMPVRLGRALDTIYKAVHEFGGTVHSISEVMVVTFNVVEANEDAARAACSCALQLLAVCKDEPWMHCAVASSMVAAGFVEASLMKPFSVFGTCMQLGLLLLRLAAVHEARLFTDERVFGQLDAQFFESRPVEIISPDFSSVKTTAYEVTHTGKRAGGGGLQSEKGRSALSAWLVVFEDYKAGLFEDAAMKLAEFESQHGTSPSSQRLNRVLSRNPNCICTLSTLEGDEKDIDNLAGLGVSE